MLLSEISTLESMDEKDCVTLDAYIVQAARRVIANSNEKSNNDAVTIERTRSFNDIISSLYSQAEHMLKHGVSLKKVLHKLQNVG